MTRTGSVLRAVALALPLSLLAAACGGDDTPDPQVITDAAADRADGKAGSGGADASKPEASTDASDEETADAEALDGADDDGAVADAGPDALDDAAQDDVTEQDVSQEDVGTQDVAPEVEPDVAPDVEPEASGPTKLRIVAANLTTGNGQSWDPGHGKRILQGIHADVVLIQEFKYGDNTPTAIRGFVDETFDPSFAYYRETGAMIPNGVISRYPIAEGGTWDDPEVMDRGFAWARIDLPGPKDLLAVSVHLLNSGTAGERNAEATALLGYINAQMPSMDALVVIGGDFNTQTRTESCYDTLDARFVTIGPWPVDQKNNSNTNAKRQLPYDWVLASTALDPLEVPVVIGANTFPNGLVVDTRVYNPIDDLSPALSTDSAALNMQHMAVVRDFVIP